MSRSFASVFARRARGVLGLLGVLGALAGCSAAPETVSPTPEGLLFTSAVDPTGSEVERAVARLARLDAAPCRRTRLALSPDLAHELFVRSPQPSLRAESAASLEDSGYRVSQAARAAAPEAHDRLRAAFVAWIDDQSGEAAELEAGFMALGDPLLACEVAQRARGRGVALPRPRPRVGVQRARHAWEDLALAAAQGAAPAELGAEALRTARAQQHLGILDGIEQLCAAGAVQLSPDERTLLALDRARVALLRRDGARALRSAIVAVRTEPGPTRRRALLLLARAQLLVGERDAALAEAQRASEESAAAQAPADEARSLGLLGTIFLSLSKPEAAASSFERAQRAAERAGQPDLALRHGLNLATAELRAGRLSAARAALSSVKALDPAGPDRAELVGQRSVTAALIGLVGGELRPVAAALEVEDALRAAGEAGCPELLERYATLPARLRGAQGSGG